MPKRRTMTDRTALRILWAATGAMFAFFVVFAMIRIVDWSYGADTGTFYQVVLHSFSGMRDGPEHGTHWVFHWSPSLAMLWPFVALFRSTLTLQIVEIIAILACTPLVYLLSRTRAEPALALRLALLTLAYPPLLSIAFQEFHELALFPALVLAGSLALTRRKYALFGVVALAALGIREDVCLSIGVVMLALAAYWARRDVARALCAIATSAAALAALALYYLIIVPKSGGWQPSHFYSYSFAATPFALVAAFFTMPLRAFGAILNFGRFTYLLEAFVPLLFLPFRSRVLLLTLPGFAIVLLANSGEVWHMGEHYAALWIPWLLLAMISACSAPSFLRFRPERWLGAAIIVCILNLTFVNPMHPGHYLRAEYRDLGAVRAALACIPRDAGIDTHDEWYSAIIATHPGATINDLTQPYWLFADDYSNRAFQRSILPQLAHAVAQHRYRVLCTRDRVKAYIQNGYRSNGRPISAFASRRASKR